ncbi:MAG: glycosyltransferase [Rhodospirillales bacterium]|nr:glycosyltransferase [Rhodospirillales bacterium]
MSYLISQYPVTHDYLDRLSKKTGEELETLVVSTITAQGYLAIFNFFRTLESESVYIPIFDKSTEPLVPPLRLLAMLVRTRRRRIVRPDLTFQDFGWGLALAGGARMVVGIADGIFAASLQWLRLGRLIKKPRVPVQDKGEGRILYLKTSLWLGVQAGGSVAHTSGVVKGFINKGLKVNFTSVETPIAMPKSEALKFNPVNPKSTYVIPRELNHFRHNKPFIDSGSSRLDLSKGLIYQRLSLGNYAGVILSRRYGLPLVIEYNGSESWLAKNWGTPLNFKELAMRTENACLHHAHLVVTVSETLKKELINRGVEKSRIVTYPNGVDTNLFDPGRFSQTDISELRKNYGIAKGSLVVTFVGTFGPWHGAEIFADSLNKIFKADPNWLEAHKVNFMFIGDGVRRKVVEELTSDAEIKKFVTITGLIDQEETPLYLAASDILVSPHVRNPDGSPFFGSPTKLFEYLSSGRPVIASDLGQIGDVLGGCPHVSVLGDGGEEPTKGISGILVQPEDVGELADAVKFLVENPEWRKVAGRNARFLALDRYTWDHHVGAILDGLKRAYALDAVATKPKIRLLFNGLHSKSGGGVTYLKNVLPLMARDRDIDLHLCVHDDQRAFLSNNLEGITIHYLGFPQGFWRLLWREQIDIPRLAKKISADVTFSPANYGPLWAPNAVILLRNALSVAFVERRPSKILYWALVYIGTFLSLLMSKKAITVSEYALSAASGGLMGFFGDRFTVVSHGVSGIFSPPEKGAKRENFLLAVSDLYIQKNFKNLISAMVRLKTEHPDLTLKIAGRPVDEAYFKELKQKVAEEKLEDRVEFLGGVSPKDLVGLYQRCGVFVFPSTVETFGNPLVEAMACGAPIASSRTAAMPEVAGDAAEFFDPKDVESMAMAIGRLLKDDTLCDELSRKAIERAKMFSWTDTTSKTLAVIKKAGLS